MFLFAFLPNIGVPELLCLMFAVALIVGAVLLIVFLTNSARRRARELDRENRRLRDELDRRDEPDGSSDREP